MIKDMINEVEDMKLDFIEKKEKLLDKQLEVRKSLSMKKIEPIFEYENEDAWLEVLKEELELNVMQDKAKLQEARVAIMQNREQREEIEKMRGGKK